MDRLFSRAPKKSALTSAEMQEKAACRAIKKMEKPLEMKMVLHTKKKRGEPFMDHFWKFSASFLVSRS